MTNQILAFMIILSAISSFTGGFYIKSVINRSVGDNLSASKIDSLTVEPIKQINGEFDLPGSKSLTNRVLLLAALSEGTTVGIGLQLDSGYSLL